MIISIGAKDLYFRGDYKVFFEPDNPQRLAYENMQRIFTKNESVSIVISQSGSDLFNQESLSLIKRLSDDSWQIPLSTRVDSITNFQHTYDQDNDLVVEDLLLELDWLSDAYIKRMKAVSLNELDLVNKLISPDGKVAMININVQLPDGDQTAEITEIGNYVRNMIAPYQEEFKAHEIRLSGIVIMTDAMFLAAQKDAQTLFPLMFLLITFLLILLMRSFLAVLATLIIVFTSIGATMGIGGWAGLFMNIATVNVPIIIMTLAIADSVHLLSGMRYRMQLGDDKITAIKYSLALNMRPIIITSATTAIGFLSLNFAKVPILSDLGNLVAVGVFFACLLSLTLLPALLFIMPIRFVPSANINSTSQWTNIAELVRKNIRILLLCCLVLAIGGSYLSSQNRLNDIVIEYFNKENSFRQDADFQQNNLSGLSNVDFAIYTDTENGINDPAFLAHIEAFTVWLNQQEEVDHVVSYSNTIKRLSKNMNQDDDDFYRLPDTQNLAAQYLLLYEMSLPFGLDINNQIDINKSAVRIMVTLKNLGSTEFTDFEARAKEFMQQNAAQYRVEAASIPLIFAHISKTNMQSMIQGAVIALLIISALLVFALRSLKLGLISLLPNLLPALMGFGFWALYSANISMALSVVLTMTLGIIVDDTVHFLSKFKSALDKGYNALQSVEFAFKNVGNALLITTVVLASGFSVLAFSDFAINSEMGMLTAIIIVAALVIDLTLLPALLLFIYGRENNRAKSSE
jgi:predicted RND superfamily exporter protein